MQKTTQNNLLSHNYHAGVQAWTPCIGSVDFILTDLAGKVVEQISISKSTNEIELTFGQVTNGFYLLNVNGSHFNKTFKVIFN